MKFATMGFLVLLSLAAAGLQAQPVPQYELTVRNPVLDGTTYRFDIVVRRVGATAWRMGNSQFIMSFNSGAFTSPVISRVAASEQIGSGFFFDQVISGSELRISVGGNGSYTSATDIAAADPGTRVSTYEISGVNVPEPSAGLVWINSPALVRTGVSEINGSDNYRDITDAAGHINGGSEFARYSGYKFNDMNGNGIWDQPAEPALSGWVIQLTRDSVTQSATTGSGTWPAGYYEFINVSPDTFTVTEVAQSGWTATASPASPVILLPGQNSQNNNFGNFNGPTLRGTKFLDVNGDSTKDLGEPGLAGWQIVATKVGGGGLKTQTTNGTGDYVFTFLPSEVGSWQISETAQPNWIQTVPTSPAVYTETILSGSAITGIDFGNFYGATISGSKFNDFNRDSLRDGFEAPVSGWLIHLRRNGVHVDSQYTDAGGAYLFSPLPAGSYEVSEEARPGWSQTVPAPPGVYQVTVAMSGVADTGKVFGNYHIVPSGGSGSLSGVKFEDMNGNSVHDSGDAPLANWKIRLWIGALPVDSTTSDTAGHYAFTSLDDGIYTVTEDMPAGWIRSLPPDPGSYQVTIGDTQRTFTGLDFGNYRYGSLAGIVYRDVNHNGAKSITEPGLAGLTLDVAGPSGPLQMQSLPGGVWGFDSLRPGLYTVTEQLQPGFYLTQPLSGLYAINLTSGALLTGLNFGNSVVRDTFDFRSFSYDSLALSRDERMRPAKPVRRKPDKVEFCKIYVNTTATEVDGLDLIFHSPLYYNDPRLPYFVEPVPVNIVVRSNGYKIDMTFNPPIQPGDTVEFCGWAKGGKLQQHANVTWLAHGQRMTTADLHLSPEFYLNLPRLPMPNALNAAQEAFLVGGFGPGNLVVGVPRLDHPRLSGWVRMKRFNDLQRSVVQRGVLHTGGPKGFDFFSSGQLFVREQRSVLPSRHSNRLFGDLVALRVNIAASELGYTPVGFGELIYDDEIAPLSGLMLTEIAGVADTALTYWGGHTPADYVRLDTVIRRINSAFEGPIDTVSFGTVLRYIGYGKLRDVPFLRANPNVEPKRVEPGPRQEPELPEEYTLMQNYPNPFNPATTIDFTLPEAGPVSLKVYDLLGREVAVLLQNEEFDEGEYEWTFDAAGLPSGIYFYRLQAGSFDRSMKMILLK